LWERKKSTYVKNSLAKCQLNLTCSFLNGISKYFLSQEVAVNE
jgi:hypothetical protein